MIYKTPVKIHEPNYREVQNEIVEGINNLKEDEDVIIDLEQTKYVSSAGLIPLMIGYKEAKEKGCEFKAINPQPIVEEIFRLTGLNKSFLGDENTSDKTK